MMLQLFKCIKWIFFKKTPHYETIFNGKLNYHNFSRTEKKSQLALNKNSYTRNPEIKAKRLN